MSYLAPTLGVIALLLGCVFLGMMMPAIARVQTDVLLAIMPRFVPYRARVQRAYFILGWIVIIGMVLTIPLSMIPS